MYRGLPGWRKTPWAPARCPRPARRSRRARSARMAITDYWCRSTDPRIHVRLASAIAACAPARWSRDPGRTMAWQPSRRRSGYVAPGRPRTAMGDSPRPGRAAGTIRGNSPRRDKPARTTSLRRSRPARLPDPTTTMASSAARLSAVAAAVATAGMFGEPINANRFSATSTTTRPHKQPAIPSQPLSPTHDIAPSRMVLTSGRP